MIYLRFKEIRKRRENLLSLKPNFKNEIKNFVTVMPSRSTA